MQLVEKKIQLSCRELNPEGRVRKTSNFRSPHSYSAYSEGHLSVGVHVCDAGSPLRDASAREAESKYFRVMVCFLALGHSVIRTRLNEGGE